MKHKSAAALFILTMKPGGGVANTAVPTHDGTSPVIGTQITGTAGTWTGTPVLTYQWQRNTGSWADIGGATSINYTPVDADFGYTLRLAEIPNGDAGAAAYSGATATVAEQPSQSLGSELLSNPSFTAWTADNPDGWSVAETAPNDIVTESVNGAQFINDASGAFDPNIRQTILTVGSYYQIEAECSAWSSGNIYGQDTSNGLRITFGSTGTRRNVDRATSTQWGLTVFSTNTDVTMRQASVKLVTLNTQLTGPSANMRIDQFFTLPGTPVTGEKIWVMPRISDFSAGNYWLALLTYESSQWDIYLYSVATYTRTARISAANVGATNGIRINMNGDSISLYTTANGGTNWTQRGSTISNSTYNTATGVNVIASSGFTLGQLRYAAAD